MRDNPLLALIAVFAPLSFLTIGGGQSVIADIHRQVIIEHPWLTEAQFVDAFAISRMSPGPGSLLVTLIGFQVSGWAGAMVASAAIFLPSSLLVYFLARVWARHRGARWQRAVEAGLRPMAAGLVLASSLAVLRAAEGGWLAWVMAAVSTAVLMRTRTSPFVMLGAGAALFLAALR